MTRETLPGKGVTTVSGPGKAQRRGRARAESAPRDVRRGSDLAISRHAPYLQLGADNDAWDSCPGPTWKLFKVASGAIEALEMGRESHRRDCAESQEETASAPAGFLTRSSEPAASQGVGARPTRPDSLPREIPEDRQPSRRPRSCRTPDLWCPGLLPSHGNAMASLSPSTDCCDQFGGVGGEANRELSVDPIQAKKIICSSAQVRPPASLHPTPGILLHWNKKRCCPVITGSHRRRNRPGGRWQRDAIKLPNLGPEGFAEPGTPQRWSLRTYGEVRNVRIL